MIISYKLHSCRIPIIHQQDRPTLRSSTSVRFCTSTSTTTTATSPPKAKAKAKASSSDPPPPSPPSVFPSIFSIQDWVDEIKERGMRRKRMLYTPQSWRDHRSSRRHLRHVISSFSSRVILSLIPPVSFFTAFATAVAAYNYSVSVGWTFQWLPILRASPLPYQLTAPALALLLVFRTEASYERYVEGRKTWRRVTSGASELAMAVIAMKFTNGPEEDKIKKALLSYILAFPIALKCHVISDSDAHMELQDMIDKDDLQVVLSSKHRPRCIIAFISQSIQLLRMEETKRNILESKLSCFHEGIGICEQLMGIPIPLSYTRLTSRFLVFWHLTLPFILWDDCNWLVIPATFISAASLFCIEEVGVLIEEPFPVLALDELCKQFLRSIEEELNIESYVKARVLAKQTRLSESNTTNGCAKPKLY